MVKRFDDVKYDTFSLWTDMVVVCPKCGKAGIVHFDKEHNVAIFQCEACYAKKEIMPCANYAFEVTAQCTSTGKYFRLSMPENKIHGSKIKVKCPYCEEVVIGDVFDNRNQQHIVYNDIRHAEDPYFQYALYFQARFRGKTIWALNREHLQYLINFLSADIRTVQPDFYKVYKTMHSQSDILPTFMKTAKNRDKIVKLLIKLQIKA
ncbi:MAG: hypothetical protein J6C19_10780 [Lachnospiraceae bacterium]|nr:hypothetical protein [Lachnospiraceae bacterium]MBO5146000.1 hypothetical protein [Lachnospiraceae bacterium]